jgi:hypothetical protein
MFQQFIIGSEPALEALAPSVASECEQLLGDKTPRPVSVFAASEE